MANKTFYECGCMVQGDQEFLCAKHKAGASQAGAAPIISKFCSTGEHGWCANRNYEESHCQCPCHAAKQEAADRKELARLLAKYGQSGAAAPDVERLIERAKAFLAEGWQETGCDAEMEAFLVSIPAALSAAHAEIERLKAELLDVRGAMAGRGRP